MECKKCPECNEIYFDFLFFKAKTCTSCKTSTEKETCYSRLRIERFALIYTISLVITIALIFVVGKKNVANYVGLFFGFLLIFPYSLMFINFMVHDYLSGSINANKKTKKELSMFKEFYLQNNKPAEEKLVFSWPKYFKEAIHFVGIFLIFVFLIAGVTIFRKLLFGK